MKIPRVWWSGLSRGAGVLAALALAVLAVGCGDIFRPVAIPITGPPGDPQATSYAFVVSQNAPSTNGSILQINVPGDSAVFSTAAGLGAVYATFLPPGESRIFVANRDDDTLTTYLPSLTAQAPVLVNLPAGSRPVFLASTETGKMYVADVGDSSASPPVPSSIGVVDALQTAFSTSIPLCSTNTNPCTAPPAMPVALAETKDGKKLYSVNQGYGTVSVIDTARDVVLRNITVGTSPVWAAFSPDNLELYVLNQGSNSVSVIDTTTDAVVATLPAGTSPVHMFVDTQLDRLYVVDADSGNNLWIFDASVDPPKPLATVTVQPDATAAVPPLPTSVTVLANGQKAYVASLQPNTPAGKVTVWYSVINATSNTVQSARAFTPAPALCNPNNVPFTQAGGVRFPAFIASSSNSNRVYVSSCDAGVVHVVSTSNDSPVTDIAMPVSSFPPPSSTSPPPPQQPVFILPGP
jgi:YVTN family beta-propeller protein